MSIDVNDFQLVIGCYFVYQCYYFGGIDVEVDDYFVVLYVCYGYYCFFNLLYGVGCGYCCGCDWFVLCNGEVVGVMQVDLCNV